MELDDEEEIIDPYDIKEYEIFSGVRVNPWDEFHYDRPLHTGKKPVEKIAYGNIEFRKES